MSSKDRYDRQLDGLLNAMDRSLVEASDAEILEDAKLAGIDFAANASRMRERFLGVARVYHKRKFVEAKDAYASEVDNLQRRTFRIPASPIQQRALLQQAQKSISVSAFRDFEGMPDSDLPGLIEELYALGLIPPEDEKE
jgi:hypothetical protein